MIIMRMLKLSKLNLFSKCMFKKNLLLSWTCEQKCGLGDFLTFIISCICNVLKVIMFYFNDIYTKYVMDS